MTIAVLFPGQGASPFALVRELGAEPELRIASDATSVDIVRAARRNDSVLSRLDVRQATSIAVSLAVHRRLEIVDARCAGHSLGELAAWAAAGAIDAGEAIRMAAHRGRLMAAEAERHPGDLVVVSDLDAALSIPDVHLAAHNAPDEWVVAAPSSSLPSLIASGGRRLQLGGPWHHPDMRAVREPFAEVLGAVRFRAAEIIGSAGEPSNDPVGSLLDQLDRPVRWVAVQRSLSASSAFVTVGPGKILRALLRKTLGSVVVHTSEHLEDLAHTRIALRSAA